ncbi:MAG: 50S ribosomal protein L18 [Candidatus Niyogibacteria bacterium]|nr:50S ribosomal protein L18 [Candidatus Niyogibacteria bacterium]
MNKDRKQLKEKRARRTKRIRARIQGTKERPRLSVFHSNRNMYVQLIDDVEGKTLLGMGGVKKKKPATKKKAISKTEAAHDLGKKIAASALKKGITSIIFDRGKHLYHGRLKAVAEGAREGGLIF